MRLVSLSNKLREIARVYYRRRFPITVAWSAEGRSRIFPSLSREPTVRILNAKCFAEGISIPKEFLPQIWNFCAKAEFSQNLEPGKNVAVDLSDETNPAPPSFLFWCTNVHQKCDYIDAIAVVADPRKPTAGGSCLSRPEIIAARDPVSAHVAVVLTVVGNVRPG